MYKFTVFTPTYNRSCGLRSVYQCLINQSFKDFEWVIVDDGSTDNTKLVVDEFLRESLIKIRYFHQKNSGKHVAFNLATKMAKGEFFLNIDSDDTCQLDALEVLNKSWNEIPSNEKEKYSGICCFCKNSFEDDAFSNNLPKEVTGPFFLVDASLDCYSEKWGFHKTSILREYPFPEFLGEKFVPEALIWNRISLDYDVKLIPNKLRVYKVALDGLSAQSVLNRRKSPQSTALYYSELFNLKIGTLSNIKALISLWRFDPFNATGIPIRSCRKNFLLFPIAFMVGIQLYTLDSLKIFVERIFRKSNDHR